MGLRVIFGAIITVALCTWCGLLYSVFASEISQPNPPDPCAGVARVLWSSRVVLRTETVPAAIHVGADGRIAEVRAAVTRAAAAQWASRELRLPLEAYEDGEVISPGVVDSAAHLAHAEHGGIGRTWEGFATGTQAAAAGGVTTVVDLPDLSPTLTSSAAALHQKTEAARGQLHADVGFWGAVTPDHARDRLGLRELLDAGALGLVALLGGGDEHADEAGGAAGHVRAMECSTAAECRRLNARGRADDEAARWRREAEAFTREAMRVRAAQAATERQREAEEAGWRDFYKEVQSELRERGRQVMELQALSARLQREQEGAVPGPFMASLASTPRSRTPPRRGGDYDRPSPGTVSPRSPGGGPPRTPRRSPADGSADTPRRLAEVDASLRGARGALAAHAEHAAELDAENERLRRELHEVNARARKLQAALAGMADELG